MIFSKAMAQADGSATVFACNGVYRCELLLTALHWALLLVVHLGVVRGVASGAGMPVEWYKEDVRRGLKLHR